MKRTGPKAELAELKRQIKKIEDQFVKAHLVAPSLTAPTPKETLDVAAYVVLVHGAFENFIEGIALWVADRAVNSWIYKKRTTRSTSSLLLYEDIPSNQNFSLSVFDNIRKSLDSAKTRVSKAVENNNGITMVHLQSLFMPLGVSVPSSPVLAASLNLLVKLRHQWAHQYRHVAKEVKSAADVKTTVADCLTIAEQLSSEASAVRP